MILVDSIWKDIPWDVIKLSNCCESNTRMIYLKKLFGIDINKIRIPIFQTVFNDLCII